MGEGARVDQPYKHVEIYLLQIVRVPLRRKPGEHFGQEEISFNLTHSLEFLIRRCDLIRVG